MPKINHQIANYHNRPILQNSLKNNVNKLIRKINVSVPKTASVSCTRNLWQCKVQTYKAGVKQPVKRLAIWARKTETGWSHQKAPIHRRRRQRHRYFDLRGLQVRKRKRSLDRSPCPPRLCYGWRYDWLTSGKRVLLTNTREKQRQRRSSACGCNVHCRYNSLLPAHS